MANMRVTILVLAATVWLHGCSTLNEWQVHDRFHGVRAVYDAHPAMDVLFVHGIGQAMRGADEPGAGYSSGMQRHLANRLSIAAGAVSGGFTISHNGVTLGTVTVTTSEGPAQKRVTFYELSWAEAVKRAKIQLLELDPANGYRETGPLQDRRADLNSTGKAFVNTHLADALIYSGQFGETLRKIVEEAFCIMTRADPGRAEKCDVNSVAKTPVPLAIVSESLGSALVFDTLWDLYADKGNKARVALQIAGSMRQLYMFANQIPLLELRVLHAPENAQWLANYPCPKGRQLTLARGVPQGLSGFVEMRQQALMVTALAAEPFSVTAFSDPNDLLTYFISDRFKSHCSGISFANVTVTNADKALLTKFADPIRAHTGFRENTRVLDMIVDGGAP